MNYYPHHIGDYLRDTVHLSLMEHGAYRRLLDYYYASEKPLPLETQWVCKLIRADSEQEREAVAWVLSNFFVKRADGWHNKRADDEIRSSNSRAKVARNNGKKGGRPKTQRVISGIAKPNPADNPDESSQNQTQTQNQKPKEKQEVAMLPSWLPAEAWKAWLEVRRKNKAPNTPRALNLAITELTRLKSLGFDPQRVIDQSVLNGWKAFYPLKEGAVSAEPAGKLCDYCTAVSSGAVNGRRACSEHWGRAMDNEKPLAKAPVVVDMKMRSAGG